MLRATARKAASVMFALALLIVALSAYVALVYHGDISAGAEWIVLLSFGEWIAIFAVALAVVLLILVVLFLVRVDTPAAESSAPGSEVKIECRDCHKAYVITDTGERPLMHACPHCGYTDSYPPAEEPATVDAIPEGTPAPAAATFASAAPAGPEALVLHCTSCGTNFEVPYTEERPLLANCANCGKKGILRVGAPTRPEPLGGAEPAAA